MIATCSTCFRRERRDEGAVHVEVEGLVRKPSVHPVLAAWRSIRDARRDGRAIVGACPCGQPLLADAGPIAPWTLALPGGDVQIGEAITGPDGPLDELAVDRLVEAAYAEPWRIRPLQGAFEGVLLSALIGPVLLWVFAVGAVVLFLIRFASPVGFR